MLCCPCVPLVPLVLHSHVQLMMLRRHLAALGVELTPEEEAQLTAEVRACHAALLLRAELCEMQLHSHLTHLQAALVQTKQWQHVLPPRAQQLVSGEGGGSRAQCALQSALPKFMSSR